MTVSADVMDALILGTVHDYGEHALLVEFDGNAEVLAWCEALRAADLPGVVQVVDTAPVQVCDTLGGATIVVTVKLNRSLVTVMMALPAAIPERIAESPVADTILTFVVSEEVHSTRRPVSGTPALSNRVATSFSVPPTASVGDGESRPIDTTRASG